MSHADKANSTPFPSPGQVQNRRMAQSHGAFRRYFCQTFHTAPRPLFHGARLLRPLLSGGHLFPTSISEFCVHPFRRAPLRIEYFFHSFLSCPPISAVVGFARI